MVDSISAFRKECKLAEAIYCYGAGAVGKKVSRILDLWNFNFIGFVVSSLSDKVSNGYDLPISTIDDAVYSERTLFIVAVSEKYQNDIIKKLVTRGITRYIVLSSNLLKWIYCKLYLEKLKYEYKINHKFFLENNYSIEANSNNILHIIKVDRKFTAGYINFMKVIMHKYNHFFVLIKYSNEEIETVNNDNLFYFDSYEDIRCNSTMRYLVSIAEKIIISGIWTGDFGIYPQSILDKVYLHFWGGDFYGLRYKYQNRKEIIRPQRFLKYRLLRRCHANIFLIKTEVCAFYDITRIGKISYAAPMPGDPLKKDEYIYHKQYETIRSIRVAVGNSATKENHHIEVFNMLAKWKNQIEIICPLSYGDEEYRKQVIEAGWNILGESFKPIVEFMDYQSFIDLLGTCVVGIYYNDRQQAGGNIYIHLRLGNKLYLRKGTSMYNEYIDRGCKIYDVEEISCKSLEEFTAFSAEFAKINGNVACAMYDIDVIKKQWEDVLASG